MGPVFVLVLVLAGLVLVLVLVALILVLVLVLVGPVLVNITGTDYRHKAHHINYLFQVPVVHPI